MSEQEKNQQVEEDKPLFGKPSRFERTWVEDQPPLEEPRSKQDQRRQAINEFQRDSFTFRTFEEKNLEQQADYITHALMWGEEGVPLFSFDTQDQIKKREVQKSLTGGLISITLISVISMRTLKRMKSAAKAGPFNISHKKFWLCHVKILNFMMINLLNFPVYYYFYQDYFSKVLDLEKYLVGKYLILGDEVLYKKIGEESVGASTSHPNIV